MSDLVQVAHLLEGLQSAALAVHPERCVRVRHRKAACDRCAEACSAQAIGVAAGGGGLEIDPDLCVGCGCCATVCPTSALEPTGPSSGEMLAAGLSLIDGDLPVVYACPRALEGRRGGGVVCVSCLGRLDETVLVGLQLGGAPETLLVDGFCADCPQRTALDVTRRMVGNSADVLRWFGVEPTARFVDDIPESVLEAWRGAMPETPGGYTRRDFLGRMKHGAGNIAYDIAAETIALEKDEAGEQALIDRLRMNADGVMPQQVVVRRERLLDYLDRLGTPVDTDQPSRLWGRVTIDTERCDACHMCATFCPTGALYREPDGEGLEFLATDCTGCRLCETACFKGILTVEDVARPAGLIACDVERFDVKAPEKGKGGMRFTARR